MKTVTEVFDVYSYNELDEAAKQKVKEWYLEGQDSDLFTDMVETDLSYLLPNSDLKIQYSLGYSQGDGFNIYGTFTLDDIMQHLQGYSNKEVRTLQFYCNNTDVLQLPYNNSHYDYCICDRLDIYDDMTYELEDQELTGIKYDLIDRFQEDVSSYFCDLCSQYEEQGYAYFYEVDDTTLLEYCNDNDYMFLKDGKIYG